jgi:drug/metabolite transporter (DMT)-like permease
MLLVGSAVVAAKVIAAELPVMLAAWLTSAISGPVLLGLFWAREGRAGLPAWRDLGIIAFQAFTGSFLWRILLFHGVALSSAAEGGIINSMTPAAVAVLALLLGERIGLARWAAIGLCVLGILAINLPGDEIVARGPNPLLGNLLLLGSVVGEALFTVCGKAVLGRVTPLGVAAMLTSITFLMFLPFGLYDLATREIAASPAAWWMVVYFALGLNVGAFLLWFWGVQRVAASTAAVFTGLLPISALVLAYSLLGEEFLWSHAVGAACVVAAIVMIAREERGA